MKANPNWQFIKEKKKNLNFESERKDIEYLKRIYKIEYNLTFLDEEGFYKLSEFETHWEKHKDKFDEI